MEKTKYEKKPWYANMKPNEAEIWERFLRTYPSAFEEVVYNLKVGEGAEIPEGTQPNIAKSFKELTQHKIDVVAFWRNETTIIELKSYAGMGAVGQVIGYKALYQKHIDPKSNPILMIVTDEIRTDTLDVCAEHGIKLIAV